MLINCVAYQEGRKLASIGLDEIPHYLAQPRCFVWMALHDASEEELQVAQREFGLHELAVEDVRHGNQRPKVEEYDDTVFVVMHTLERGAHEPLEVGEVSVFAGSNFVLSVRNRSAQGFWDVRQRAEREPQSLCQGPGFVLYALMDAVVDRYFPFIETFEDDLEAIEAKIFTPGAARANTQQLYELKQRITLARHVVAPLQEAASKLWGGRVPRVCANSGDYMRDVYDHLTRINASLETLRETIVMGIQVNLSMVTIEESETAKRLAAWAGIFAVATALAGIWGMNFEHMPELKWRYGYPMALGLIFAACLLLYRRFKRIGWL
ncbi:MAG: magnesium/cobalt transporter CorA [Burkholderiaceae bacterium]|nr:magnesium/cobalt transporter CorA [Burkholderiaceae bacterium]